MKFLGWFILGIIVLLILAGLLIQTRPVKQKLAEIATKQAANFVNGNVSLEEINGNFFTNLQLKNLLWTYESDTVAFIANLDLQYNLRPLLNGHLLIKSVEIDQPLFHLKQVNDSTWNITELIKPTSSATDSTDSESNFQVDLQAVQLNEGKILLTTPDTLIPEQIQHLNSNLSLHWEENRQSVQLKNFSFVSKKPDVTLTQLAFNVTRDTTMIDLTGFQLKTQQNQLTGKGTYLPPTNEATAHFQSTPIHPEEFEFILPDLKIPANPEFMLDARMENDSLKATINLEEKDQKIHLNISSANFVEFLSNSTQITLDYYVSGNLEKVNLAHWTGNAQLDYLINGNLTAKGMGTDPKTAVLTLNGDLKDVMIENRPVDKLVFNFNLDHGNLTGLVEGNGDFGRINLRPAVQNLFDVPVYQLALTTRQFNLAEIMGNDSLKSDINLKANITGKGFTPENMTAKVKMNASESQFQSLKLDTLIADLQYKNKNVMVDSLRVKTQSAVLTAHGNYSLKSNSDIILNARFDSIADFKSFIPLTTLKTSGKVQAHLWGSVDSLHLESAVNLDSTRYETFFLDSLTVNATAEVNGQDTVVNAKMIAFNLQNESLVIDSVLMDIKTNTDSMFMNGRVVGEDIQSTLKGRLNWQKELLITLENWTMDYKNQHLALQSSPALFKIDSTNYVINNLKIASNSSDTAQYISVEGNISTTGSENLEIKVNNVDVASWLELSENEVKAAGLANLNVNVGGTAKAPVIKGDFGINDAVLNTYKFTEFGGTFDYKGNKLNVQSNIVPVDSGRIELSGFVPLQVALDSFDFNFNPKDPINLQLNVDKFPLAVIQTLNLSEKISGYIDGNVDVTGTAEAPDPNGELKLIDAAVKIPEYGVDYHNILFNLSFLQNNISLDTLRIETADGNVSGSGKIDFSSEFYKGDISQSHISLNFDQFNPVNHRQFNMQVSGNASLSGKKGDVVFDGNLNIPESEVYLPAVLNMMGKIYVPKIPKPILVQAMEDLKDVPDSFHVSMQPKDTTEQFNLDYFNGLTGKVRIKIPRNTWVKNEDLRIELSGDLEMDKNKDFFELFGSVNVVRGQYDMLGRTFVIDEGTIRFQGGEELMPELNITATYSFRDAQRQEKKLTVNITGTANSPTVDFTLDGSAINEGDALSYMFFGKSLNELSIDQQNNIEGAGGGQIAENAAASILSAQLTNFLSDKLNVDYIEVKSDGGFDNATVVVGKYITNDLFVSYEQRFGTTDQTNIDKYEVKLEYELFKFLFLQLNNSSTDSGFDVIFKLNSNTFN